MHLGDRVMQHGEEGVVVHVEPPIMRVCAFHSYVPLREGLFTRLGTSDAPGALPSDAVVARIRAYLAGELAEAVDAPTGHGEGRAGSVG